MDKALQHNKSLSVAKGIGIILMVVGHSGCPDILNRFIYMFHMPLFFFISGYLFKDKYLDDNKLFVKRKIKGLYWPFIKWELIFLAFHNLFSYIHFYKSGYEWRNFAEMILRILTLSGGEQLLGGYWYLIQALYSSIIALFILYGIHKLYLKAKISNNGWIAKNAIGGGNALIVSSVILLVIMAFLYGEAPFSIPKLETKTLLATSYFLSGYLFARVKWKPALLFGSVCLCAILVFAVIMEQGMSIDVVGWDIFSYFVLSMIGILGMFHICFCLRGKLANALDVIGKNTLAILTFHFLAFKLVSLIKIGYLGLPIDSLSEFPIISGNNDWFWILYTLVGVAFSLFIYHILQKIKFPRKEKLNCRR